jgi:undecaprenyl-diphosphatase
VIIAHAIILSIVEGITEFLPISSTGHMILVGKILTIPQTEFLKSFEIIIQLGAILAVFLMYFKLIRQKKNMWKPILIAFIPTGIFGLTLYKLIKGYLLGSSLVVVISLFLGGLFLLFFETYFVKNQNGIAIEQLTIKQSVVIGLFQSISMIPGVSRAAATIVGSMLVGLDRKTAVEFSFLLAIPTMAAATGLDLVKNGFSFSPNEYFLLAVGFIGAFITAWFAVKTFLRFVQNHTFVPFGVYRIIIAILFFVFVR